MKSPYQHVTYGTRWGHGLALAALLTLFVCAVALVVPGCGGPKPSREQAIDRYTQELREAVSNNVPEGQRRAQMLLIVNQVETFNLRFSQQTADFVENYRKLNADYDATRPAFDQLFSDYRADRLKLRSEALDLHFQLAALATASEWKSIGKAETKLYEEVKETRPADKSTP